MQAEADYRWESIRYQRIARMIGLAALIIIAINTYQVGTNDFARVLLFDGAILIYLTGAFWCNFAFKAELLEVELEERSRATIKWQTEHPGEAQAEEQEAGDAPWSPSSAVRTARSTTRSQKPSARSRRPFRRSRRLHPWRSRLRRRNSRYRLRPWPPR